MQTSTKAILNATLIPREYGYAVLVNANDEMTGQLLARAVEIRFDEDGDLEMVLRSSPEILAALDLVDEDGETYWSTKENLGVGSLAERGHRLLVPEQAAAIVAVRKLDRAVAEQYLEEYVTTCPYNGRTVRMAVADALLPRDGAPERLAATKASLDTDYHDSDAGQGSARMRKGYVPGKSVALVVIEHCG